MLPSFNDIESGKLYVSETIRCDEFLNFAQRLKSMKDISHDSHQQLRFGDEECQYSMFETRASLPYLYDFGNVWDDAIDKVERAWGRLGSQIRDFLTDRHVRIIVVEDTNFYSMSDHPSLGYYLHEPREICISQSHNVYGDMLLPALDLAGVLLHEIGHAIDFGLGQLSKAPGFIEAYIADIGALRGTSSECYLPTYVSPKDGRLEVFAEGWRACTSSRLGFKAKSLNEPFISNFPASCNWIRTNAPSAEAGFGLPVDTINYRDKTGRTPLLNLISRGLYTHELKQLLDSGANPLARKDNYSPTILEDVVSWQWQNTTELMLARIASDDVLATSKTMADRVTGIEESITASFSDKREACLELMKRITARLATAGIGPAADGLPPDQDFYFPARPRPSSRNQAKSK